MTLFPGPLVNLQGKWLESYNIIAMERLVKFAILIHCPQCVVQGCRSPNKQGGYMIVFGKDLKKFLFLILLLD